MESILVLRFRGRATLLVVGLCALLAGSRARGDSLEDGGPGALFLVEDFVSGLGWVTDFRFLPDGRMVITEKTGGVRVRRPDGTLVPAGTFPVEELATNSLSEVGLLGVEVHPDFPSNHLLFFYYSRSDAAGGTDANRNRVVSVALGDDDTLDLSTETVLVENLAGALNHVGGALAIGPDGRLYIGVGDSGCDSGAPPGGTITNYSATCLTQGNGKILRVELDGGIPPDNPLVGETAVTACGPCDAGCGASCGTPADPGVTGPPRRELWAWGLRNPWRISFDPKTGNLWVGDVGEDTFEELDIVRKGQHLGWPYREGAAGQDVGRCAEVTPQSGVCVDPVYTCRHDDATAALDSGVDPGCEAITGGVFVDSCGWPEAYRGRYYFGDSMLGTVFALEVNATRDGLAPGPGPRSRFGGVSQGGPVSFQVGPDGNLYVAVYPFSGAGRIVRFAPLAPSPCDGGTGGGMDGGSRAPPPGACGCGVGPGASALLALGLLALMGLRVRGGRE